jgi:hypothetical protein
MTAVETSPDLRRSRLEWAVRAAWLLALLATALLLVGVLVTAGDVPAKLTADPLTVSIETAEPLHAIGQNSYGGGPFVSDAAAITATRVTAEVSGLATPTRIGLALGPLAWVLTGAGVGACLTFAFGRLVRTRPDPRRAARMFAVAGLVVALGTSAAQVLDEIARTGVQGVMWHGATGMNRLGVGAGFTFQFGWLAVAVGAVAIAAVIARQEAPSGEPV